MAGTKSPEEGLMSRMALNDHKAGMEGLDKAKINQIIYEASKGSKFFENEKKKEEQMKERIEDQKRRLENITSTEAFTGLDEADAVLQELDRSFDLSRTIVHVDMDAFYAAVEMRDDPSLRNKPMAVGGTGMLSTSNYLARKFGVRAAMPGFIALKLCPNLVLVKPNYNQYTAVSKDIRSVMADYDPNFCPMSLDEAYLDFTEHLSKRELFSEKDRTFLVKDSSLNDENMCKCDLNNHLRNVVVFGEVESRLTESANGKEGEDKESKDKKKMKKNGDPIGDITVTGIETNSKKDCASTEANSDNHNTLTADVNDHQDTPSSQQSLVFSNSSQIENQMLLTCPSCNKPYPPYSIETFGTYVEEAVREMRCRIEQKTQLTASAGIACNMMISKVCSDKNKPNGQYRVLPTREAVKQFIDDLPIRKISGIGKVTEQMLNSLNIVKCIDLYDQRAILYHLYSDTSFHYFMRICLGIGSTTVKRDSERKSMSNERTFRDLSDQADLYRKCLELSEALMKDLKEEGLKGKTVTLKLKTATFKVKTRAQTLRDYTWDQDIINTTCKELLRIEIQNAQPESLTLRLMGVRMSNLLHHSLCPKSETLSDYFKKVKDKQISDAGDSINNSNNDSTSVPNDTCDSDTCCDNDNGSKSAINVPPVTQSQTNQIYKSPSPMIISPSKGKKYESPSSVTISPSKSKKTIPKERSVKDLFLNDKKYLCPVCNKNINCRSMLEMNCHVDKCLTEESRETVTITSSNITAPPPDEVPSTSTATVLHTVSTSDEHKPINGCEDGQTDDKQGKITQSNFYTCPVCDVEKLYSSLEEFNLHVDGCLSRGAIKDILLEQKHDISNNPSVTKKRRLNDQDKKSSQLSKKNKSSDFKTKSIDSFFKS